MAFLPTYALRITVARNEGTGDLVCEVLRYGCFQRLEQGVCGRRRLQFNKKRISDVIVRKVGTGGDVEIQQRNAFVDRSPISIIYQVRVR